MGIVRVEWGCMWMWGVGGGGVLVSLCVGGRVVVGGGG